MAIAPGLPEATTSTWKATAMWMLAFGHHEDRIPTRGYAGDTRGRNGRVCQELAAEMTKRRRTYEPRVFRPRASSERPLGTPPRWRRWL
jgi:hypothetical protein